MIWQILRKNKLLVLVGAAYLLLLAFSPELAAQSLQNSKYYLLEMFLILPVVFLLTVSIETLIPKAIIVRNLGENSGLKGSMLALMLGSISAGPIYAAFPICKALLKKGLSIPNSIIILSAWAVIKVPMLANEAKFLGVDFMLQRWLLTVLAIFLMSYLAGAVLKQEDLSTERATDTGLTVQEEYCIGCGLCARLAPEAFRMQENKAGIVKSWREANTRKPILESIAKCPAGAIRLDEEFDNSRLDKG